MVITLRILLKRTANPTILSSSYSIILKLDGVRTASLFNLSPNKFWKILYCFTLSILQVAFVLSIPIKEGLVMWGVRSEPTKELLDSLIKLQRSSILIYPKLLELERVSKVISLFSLIFYVLKVVAWYYFMFFLVIISMIFFRWNANFSWRLLILCLKS